MAMASSQSRRRWALGVMTGTSMDGVDCGWIESDGERAFTAGPVHSAPMPAPLRCALRGLALEKGGDAAAIEAAYTDWVAAEVRRALALADGRDCAVVGFHGQTLKHAPARGRPGEGMSWQLGDGERLSRAVGRPVVYDFRAADVAAGGEGAPFAPLFHAAIAADWPKPIALLNMGGVGNVTYLGPQGAEPLAFDTGPANAPCDDLIRAATGAPYDRDGTIAARGRPDRERIAVWLRDPYFAASPPKSLDRETFAQLDFAGLALEDAVATAIGFAAASVAAARAHLPAAPRAWVVCGGGGANPVLMAALRDALGVRVESIEAHGWRATAIEAWAFAHLALRSLDGLPLSYPGTTGAPRPLTGGRLALEGV